MSGLSAFMEKIREQDFTNAEWDGSKSRFSVEQLARAVPEAVRAWAEDRADEEGRELVKADLKLPFKEPSGEINLNGVRAALSVLGGGRGGVDLPEDVQRSAQEELEAALERGREELGLDESQKLNEVYAPGFAFGEASVDRDQRIVRNVSLLGRHSKNNRIYSRTALTEAADLHKGVGIYFDHPTPREERETGGVRSIRDLVGRVIQASLNGDRVRGDIQALEGHEGDKLLALAEQMPGVAGFSHRATGDIKRGEDGTDIVESIEAVHGADLVTDPATVSGLFESLTEEREMKIEDLTLDDLREERPDIVESIREESEEAATVEELREENKKLESELDEYRVKEQAREREELVAEKLEEAKLPDAVVTDVLREQLVEAEGEEEIDRLIEERAKLAKQIRSSGPRSRERDHDDLFDEGVGEITPDTILEANQKLFH